MAEVVLNRFDVRAGAEGGDGVGVAQVVGVEFRDADFRAGGVGRLGKDGFGEEMAAGAAEDQVVHEGPLLPLVAGSEAGGGFVPGAF